MLPFFHMAADIGGTLTLLDRTEIRGRSPGTAPGQGASLDVETTPEARLSILSHRTTYAFTLAPRFTAWDVIASGVHPVVLASGTARVEWRGRTLRLSLDQSGSYGGMSFATFGAAPGPDGAPPRVDVIPTARVITFEAERTALTSRSLLGRWILGTTVGYQLSGGADAEARALLPFQSGPFAEARVDYALSHVDHAETALVGSQASFSSGPDDLVAELDETWRRLWRRTTETRLTLGVSEARVRTGAFSPHTTETHPVAEAVVEEHERFEEGRLDLRAGVRLGPIVNQIVGLVDERLQGTLALTHTARRLTTHAYAGASQSVPSGGIYGIRIVTGEVGASYAVDPAVAFDAGVRGVWQRQDATQATFLQGTLFAGVTFRAPPERL